MGSIPIWHIGVFIKPLNLAYLDTSGKIVVARCLPYCPCSISVSISPCHGGELGSIPDKDVRSGCVGKTYFTDIGSVYVVFPTILHCHLQVPVAHLEERSACNGKASSANLDRHI